MPLGRTRKIVPESSRLIVYIRLLGSFSLDNPLSGLPQSFLALNYFTSSLFWETMKFARLFEKQWQFFHWLPFLIFRLLVVKCYGALESFSVAVIMIFLELSLDLHNRFVRWQKTFSTIIIHRPMRLKK